MEYRCVILGDPVVEPYALLRRLLYDPFSDAETTALRRESLLSIRSSEVYNRAIRPQVAAPPPLPERWMLTMSNPSMPSVDISIRFSVVTDPPKLLQASSRGYRGKRSVAGLYQESEADGEDSGLAGFSLHQPHCVVVCFNPFSLRSFLRMRTEWAHYLELVQRQHVSHPTSTSSAFDPLSLHSPGKRTKSLMGRFFLRDSYGVDAAKASLTGGLPLSLQQGAIGAGRASGGGSQAAHNPAPTVLFVATRAELMRQVIESTPTIEVPTPVDVVETAQWIQARAYLEVNTFVEDNIDTLRLAIAQACVGDLTDAPVVGYDATDLQRMESVMRAIEAIHTNPDDETLSDDDAATEAAAMQHARSEGKDEARRLERAWSTLDSPAWATDHDDNSHDDDGGGMRRGRLRRRPGRGDVITQGSDAAEAGGLDRSDRAPGRRHRKMVGPSAHSGANRSTWTYRHHEATGRVFYVNRVTRRSQYSRPPDYDGAEPTPPSSCPTSKAASVRAASSDGTHSPASSAASDLPGHSSVHGDEAAAAKKATPPPETSPPKMSESNSEVKASLVEILRTSGAGTPTSLPRSANSDPSLDDVPSLSVSVNETGKTAVGEAVGRGGEPAALAMGAPQSARRRRVRKQNLSHTSPPLVSVGEVNDGDNDWDADRVLQQLREGRRRQREAQIKQQERLTAALRDERRQLLSLHKSNEARASHLAELTAQVSHREEDVLRQLMAEETAADEEIVRLAFAIEALTSGGGEVCVSAASSQPHAGPHDASEGEALTVPPSSELAAYGARLDAGERELREMVAQLEARQHQFWTLRTAVQQAQAEEAAVSAQLSALTAEGAALDRDEATTRAELRDVESQLQRTADAVSTARLLESARRQMPRPEPEQPRVTTSPPNGSPDGTQASRARTAPVSGELWRPDDDVSRLMGLWSEIESNSVALRKAEEQLGHTTLSKGEERQRLLLRCRELAAAVVEKLLLEAHYTYKAIQARDGVVRWLRRLDSSRAAQRDMLSREEESVRSALLHHLGSADGSSARAEEQPNRLSVGFDAHLTQLQVMRAQFEAAEGAVMAALRHRCKEDQQRVENTVAQVLGSDDGAPSLSKDTPRSDVECAEALWRSLSTSLAILCDPTDSALDAEGRSMLRGFVHDALDEAVTYGLRTEAVFDEPFQRVLQRCLHEKC